MQFIEELFYKYKNISKNEINLLQKKRYFFFLYIFNNFYNNKNFFYFNIIFVYPKIFIEMNQQKDLIQTILSNIRELYFFLNYNKLIL